jgi:hypothetical protein
MKLGPIVGLLALLAAPLAAQQDVAARLAGRVPPDVSALVQQLAADAVARGLPVDPLIQKAIEGAAKNIPSERVAIAVRAVAAQLDAAATALRDGGRNTPDTEAVAAGAFALNAGLAHADVAALARASHGRSPDVALALRVAGTLTALGVPSAETVALVSATLATGSSPSDLLTLPSQVQAQVARGATPAQAAAGLARAAAAAAGRRGPPPGKGRPQRP